MNYPHTDPDLSVVQQSSVLRPLPGADALAEWAGAILTTLSQRSAVLAEEGRLEAKAAQRLSGQELPPDALAASWLPALNGAAIRLVRRLLRRVLPSPLMRAELETLLRQSWRIEWLQTQEFAPTALLEAAEMLALGPAAALLRHYPSWDAPSMAARQETSELLTLFAAETGCEGDCFSPLISEEGLAPFLKDSADRTRLINTIRVFRLQNRIMEQWKADAFLPKQARARSSGVLYFTIGAPLTTIQAIPLVKTHIVIQAQDIRKVRHPAYRRRQLVERVQGALTKGYAVLCAANHSTQESRRELVRAARALGARVVAIYCDWSEEELEPLMAQAEVPPSRRMLNRVLETLEPPRPHEADEVLVAGPQGLMARWTSDGTFSGGFSELTESFQAAETQEEASREEAMHPRQLLELELTALDDALLCEYGLALSSDSHARPPELLSAGWATADRSSTPDVEDTDALLDPQNFPILCDEEPDSDESD